MALVILFLATVVGALYTGVISRSDQRIRTAVERELLIARTGALSPGATAESWAPYIDALVLAGDVRQAQIALEHAKGSTGPAIVPALKLSEARLLRAQDRHEAAIDAARAAMDGYAEEQKALLAAGGEIAASATKLGVDNGYYEAALVAAYAHVDLSQWSEAVTMFGVYLDAHPTAADILVDRAEAKYTLKDYAGAEADFREALRFVPYEERAQAGLEKIGAAK